MLHRYPSIDRTRRPLGYLCVTFVYSWIMWTSAHKTGVIISPTYVELPELATRTQSTPGKRRRHANTAARPTTSEISYQGTVFPAVVCSIYCVYRTAQLSSENKPIETCPAGPRQRSTAARSVYCDLSNIIQRCLLYVTENVAHILPLLRLRVLHVRVIRVIYRLQIFARQKICWFVATFPTMITWSITKSRSDKSDALPSLEPISMVLNVCRWCTSL